MYRMLQRLGVRAALHVCTVRVTCVHHQKESVSVICFGARILHVKDRRALSIYHLPDFATDHYVQKQLQCSWHSQVAQQEAVLAQPAFQDVQRRVQLPLCALIR